MITDQETLKMKQKIIEDITKIYESLLAGGKIDEVKADQILKFVKDKIAPEYHEKEFSATVFAFCKEFPEFASIEQNLKNMRDEILEKVGRECLENLMDEETDTWVELTNALEKMNEQSFNAWFSKLPQKSQHLFLNKFLKLSENAA